MAVLAGEVANRPSTVEKTQGDGRNRLFARMLTGMVITAFASAVLKQAGAGRVKLSEAVAELDLALARTCPLAKQRLGSAAWPLCRAGCQTPGRG